MFDNFLYKVDQVWLIYYDLFLTMIFVYMWQI